MHKTRLGVALAIGAIIAVPLAGGAALPEGHVAMSAVMLQQPIDSVWPVVRNLADDGKWRPNVESVEV